MLRRFFPYIFLCILGIAFSLPAYATHLRAGEITAKRVSLTSATYEVTLTTYTDEINGKGANDTQNSVIFHFGGVIPAVEVARQSRIQISRSTVVNTYVTRVTFPAPGNYTISCGIQMRNKNTINLPGDTSNIPFFVQSNISVNASFGLNSTPVLLNSPVDSAAVGVRYIHNPGAFDADGDSLSYKLDIVRTDLGGQSGVGVYVDGYQSPETIGTNPILNEAKTGPASFKINPLTGDLIWDAPQQEGQYNVAFIIYEWRKGIDGTYVRIGEIIRDMQIIVVKTDNRRPELNTPSPICIEAGQLVDFQVTATDPDSAQQIRITSSSGVYNLNQAGQVVQNVASPAATLTPNNILQKSPAAVRFRWQTNCQHIRQQEYSVVFKAEDAPSRFQTQLADLKTVTIKILPPKVKGLKATVQNTGVKLSWLPYDSCKVQGKIRIYRRQGCNGLNPGLCTEGIPAAWGYTPIKEVALTDTTFIDATALQGTNYSYRVLAELQVSPFATMQSAASIEACVGSELPQRVPVITQVTVDSTAKTAGQITVRWKHPADVDTALIKPPYRYIILRSEGLSSDTFLPIDTLQVTLNGLTADTVFVDKKLNTTDKLYRYRLAFYANQNKLIGTTPAASSVRLTIVPNDKQLRLEWAASVPWNNDNQEHRIFRKDRSGKFNQIATVKVAAGTAYTYLDKGEDTFAADGNIGEELKNDATYCYRVETVGRYEQLPALGLLRNYSQEACGSPVDRSAPCSPVLTLPPTDCATIPMDAFCQPDFFKNKLTWKMPDATPDGRNCRKDISAFRVYFSRTSAEAPKLLATVSTNEYVHQRTPTDGLAGCYYITAVSSVGVESGASNKICVDNCQKIDFPNVFTPNGDGSNDTFTPMNCPAFVNEIKIEVYNRYGAKVYASNGATLNWDGNDMNGKPLPSATYLYYITVTFNQLDGVSEAKIFKGWVELIR